MQTVTVSKLDAASRQLDNAIRLFLAEGDPVAIHTLAAAAAQVSADLMKAKGLTSLVRSASLIREDRRKEVLRTMAAPENFFKHADRDSNESIEFNPETTEYFIFASLAELQALTGKLSQAGYVFQMWFLVTHEGVLLENETTKPILEAVEKIRKGGGMEKSDFLGMLDQAIVPSTPASGM
jgi:hypothetical protein